MWSLSGRKTDKKHNDMKLSNFKKAWVSTLLGIVIGALIVALEQYQTGDVDLKTIGGALLLGLVAGLTDFLKEVQKDLGDGDGLG